MTGKYSKTNVIESYQMLSFFYNAFVSKPCSNNINVAKNKCWIIGTWHVVKANALDLWNVFFVSMLVYVKMLSLSLGILKLLLIMNEILSNEF